MKSKTLEVIAGALWWRIQEIEINQDNAKRKLAEAILDEDKRKEASRQESYDRLTKQLKEYKEAYKDFSKYVKKLEKERK